MLGYLLDLLIYSRLDPVPLDHVTCHPAIGHGHHCMQTLKSRFCAGITIWLRAQEPTVLQQCAGCPGGTRNKTEGDSRSRGRWAP